MEKSIFKSYIIIGIIIFFVGLLYPFYHDFYSRAEFETQISLLVASFGLIFAFISYYMRYFLDNKLRTTGKKIPGNFENMIYSALIYSFPLATIKRKVLYKGYKVDFILKFNNIIIPIEVKYLVEKNIVIEMIDFMDSISANYTILITHSTVNKSMKEFAMDKKVYIIDSIQFKSDIIEKLQWIQEYWEMEYHLSFRDSQKSLHFE